MFALQKTRKSATNTSNDLGFAKRFFFIVLTDAMCWFPVITIKLLAYANIRISGTSLYEKKGTIMNVESILTGTVKFCCEYCRVTGHRSMINFLFPDQFYAWIAIFILPINSSINPILYSLTTVTFRRKLLELKRKFTDGRAVRPSRGNTYSVT